MSIVTYYEPVPNRVRSLVRIVAHFGPLSRKELVEHFTPLNPKDDQASNIILETERLGLVTELEGSFRLSDGILKKDVNDNAWFLDFVERALFSKPLCKSDKNRPVAYAVAWMLAQPVSPKFKWSEELANHMQQDMNGDDVFEITNAGRAAMLSYWMRFTGYGEAMSFGNQRCILPDPTRVIARRLPSLIPIGEVLPVGKFIGNLGADLPVLESGTIRSTVESRLKKARNENTLSQTTSLALKQLELRGTIRMSEESDADTRILDIKDSIRRVSHIEHIGE